MHCVCCIINSINRIFETHPYFNRVAPSPVCVVVMVSEHYHKQSINLSKKSSGFTSTSPVTVVDLSPHSVDRITRTPHFLRVKICRLYQWWWKRRYQQLDSFRYLVKERCSSTVSTNWARIISDSDKSDHPSEQFTRNSSKPGKSPGRLNHNVYLQGCWYWQPLFPKDSFLIYEWPVTISSIL